MSASSVAVGIDVAKAHVDVSVLGAKVDAQPFDNQAEGHSALTVVLKPLEVTQAVMEATGGTRRSWSVRCKLLACRWRWSTRARRATSPSRWAVWPRPTRSMRGSRQSTSRSCCGATVGARQGSCRPVHAAEAFF